MDNSNTLYDESEIDIHPLTREMRQVHKEYGLMITGMGSGTSEAEGFLHCPKRYFEFYSISHCRNGKGRLWLEPNYEVDILPGQCVIMPPNQINRYGGHDAPYHEDMVTFFGPVADRLFKSGIIGCGVFEFGSVRRLIRIGELIADPARDSQLEANIELQRIIFDIWQSNRLNSQKKDDPITLLQKEIRKNLRRWWSVTEMAEFCCIGSEQFRRRFYKQTGMRPKEYIDQTKMHRATELLGLKSHNIAEIAEQLGYPDQFHFSRRFKAVIGLSPSQYRLQQSILRE